MKLYLDVNYYYDPPNVLLNRVSEREFLFKKENTWHIFLLCCLVPTYEMSATTIETSELPVTVISRAEETILLFLNKQGFFGKNESPVLQFMVSAHKS